ncbi:MAG: serine/threonine protein kinase, partial [Nannocystaceae bacterium]|nr:serine/threonine protein kinase [Nannocystaceae bacterium]
MVKNADTSDPTPSSRCAPTVKTLGRYEITGRLGAGSMGVVFSAIDPSLDRRVAVKVLHEGKSADPEGQQRMLREGQALARLSHPNIVEVFDVGHVGENVFVAMELVEGSTLREWLGEPRSRSWRDVVRVFSAAGRGLAAAHAAGVVHRDFKPDNVLVGTDNRVRVMDFGLALAGPASPVSSIPTSGAGESFHATRLTHAGTVFGTPAYMAPEQFAGRTVTELSDQFSFCVALYEGLFGRRPFEGETFKALASAAMTGEILPPSRNVSVPASIRKALFRGLAVAPEQRWPSMLALLAALNRRRRTRAGVVVVGGIAAVVSVELMASSPTDPCDEAGAAFRQVWNDGTRRQTRLVLAGPELAYAQDVGARVSIRMDAFAQQWAKTRRDVCLA